jgi:hypothetical protein
VVTSGNCAAATTTTAVGVTVSPVAVAKTISGNAGSTLSTTAVTICSNTTKKLTYDTIGSVGSIQWQYYNAGFSTTNITNSSTNISWNDISNATGSTYNAPSLGLIGNIWFRVKLTSSPCTASAYSTPVNVWLKSCPTIVFENNNPFSTTKTDIKFVVTAYPNPTLDSFNFSITSLSEEKVNIKVYDITGKIIEQHIVTPSELSNLKVGVLYPSGIYNIFVTQGEETKNLRVIKK